MTTAALNLTADDTHIAAFRKNTKERPLQTARHWLEVLLYLLDHPAIEVNAGFYMTPLQMCVLAGNAEVVGWLLQHPHLRPSRLPKATTALCNSYYLLQHHTLSQPAMQCVVATPLEMAAQLRHIDIFRQLARDQRIQVPVALTKDLERSAADGAAIPFLTALAQYREEWEGWGWRWRRRCTLIATAAMTTFAVCFWVMVLLWHSTLQGCLLVLTATYLGSAALSVVLYLWEVHRLRYAADGAVTHGAAALRALVRHLWPASSSLRQHIAVVTLLVCPGLLPVLDVLCAWCLFTVHRSRRRLETGAGASGDGAASSHSVTPSAAGTAGATQQATLHRHHHHQGPLPGGHHGSYHHHVANEHASATASWNWSVGVSNATEFSSDGSFSETSPTASASVTGNESFSRPRPSAAVTRRQSAAATAAKASTNHGGRSGGGNGGTYAADASYSVSLTALPPGAHGTRQVSFASDTFVSGGHVSNASMASPSIGTSRSRGPWVVPGRPSRYAFTTEYHAPDLLLRALAYTTYDTILALPRLATCVVGIFMFMYMVFPSAAPTASTASAALAGQDATPAALAEAMQHHSAFTLYYGAAAAVVTVAQPTPYNITADNTMTAAVSAATAAPMDLPTYTIGIGVVGLFGLVSSVVGGAALLAMMGSLRTVTVLAFFASPSDKADAKVGATGRVGERAAGGAGDGHGVRHRAHEVQPNYTL